MSEATTIETPQEELRDRHATRMITLRIRRDQHVRLIQAANAAGKSLNQWMIDTLLPPPVAPMASFEEWFRELERHARMRMARHFDDDSVVLDRVAWHPAYEAGMTPQQAWDRRKAKR
jgi:hypothetical protein